MCMAMTAFFTGGISENNFRYILNLTMRMVTESCDWERTGL